MKPVILTKEDVSKAVDAVLEDGHGKVLITIEDYVILEIETKRRRSKSEKRKDEAIH
jgi:hypothetical protein